MRARLLLLFLPVLLLAVTATSLHAAEPDAKVSVEDLQLELRPQRRAEVQKTVESWMELLQSVIKEAGDTRMQLEKAEGEAKTALETRLEKLAETRIHVVNRVDVVLADFEAKGGDTTEQRQYLLAIGDAREDLVEAQGLATVVWRWVKSPEGGIRIAKNIGFFLLLLLGFRIVANIAAGLAGKSLDAMGRTPKLLRNFLVNMTRNIVFFIGIVVALSQLGVDIGPMLAAIGGAGFVVGFALQSTLSNFAAGVMILLYRPYELGDIITVAATTGKVEAMTLVSTTILTMDNQVNVVPNSNIWGGVITNVTGSSTRRVDLTFGIGYEDDMDKAQAILEEVASAHPKVLDTPETVVKVGVLNASSVDYVVRPWCKTEDYWDVFWDLTRQVKERFDAEGISIPYPQTDIHVHQVAGAAGDAPTDESKS